MKNATRKAKGRALLRFLEDQYSSAAHADNLTDGLADLLHYGVSQEILERALRCALDNYRTEKETDR